jgi:hypothetical protein
MKGNGTPVVVFRIEGGDRQPLQISGAQLIRGDLGIVPFIPHATAWNPSEPWSIQKSSADQNEFSVLAPTNAPVWQLAVLVSMENPKLLERLLHKRFLWNVFRLQGNSIYNAARRSWNTFSVEDQAVLASELITNGVPDKVNRSARYF